MNQYIHEDYDYDDSRILSISQHSMEFYKILLGLAEDVEKSDDTSICWMGTLCINGKDAQVQLSVTSEPNKFVDEN